MLSNSWLSEFSVYVMYLEVVQIQELVFVIMDNIPVHNGAAFHDNQQQVRKVLLYSPFLNSIKEAFSALKAAIQK